jgi:hypothetical protein
VLQVTMLLDRAGASKVAEAWCAYTQSRQLDLTGAVETERGWYFPWMADGIIGSNGVIVGKSDGAVFVFGSAFSVKRDIHFFDRGFGSDSYDLVILEVFDMSAAIALMEAIRPSVVEPSYESGTVWRVGKDLTSEEIRDRLSAPPALFPDIKLYFRLELLDEAEGSHVFTYRVFPRRSASK